VKWMRFVRLRDDIDSSLSRDAAQAVDSFYKGQPLGSFGDMATFSFHQTKNLQCGQGGLTVINKAELFQRAEYVWEKGTNRSRFIRGEVDKYRWVDLGSCYLPGEPVAALLWAQLTRLDEIQQERCRIWNRYREELDSLPERVRLPILPSNASVNGHMFYLVFEDSQDKLDFLDYLGDIRFEP
jgi:dTDP-4-amino-4,6-dideoxygalactose transaminase